MIKPIFFPHTYISPATAAAIRSAFAAVAAYQPVAGRLTPDMRALVASGFLEVVGPPPEDEERVERLLQEFERWGRLRQGGAGLLALFLSSRPGLDPLTADGNAAQIASEVRRRSAGAPPAVPEARMRSAVFLQLAHQADQQAYQVHAELQRCAAAQADLLAALAGEAARPSAAPAPQPAGPSLPEGESLLKHRLRAWARLFRQRPHASPVFVAASPEVVGLLAEQFPSLRRIGRTALDRTGGGPQPSAPPAGGGLMAQLERLATRPLPDPGACDEGGNADPAIHVIPDLTPLQVFARLAASGDEPAVAAAAPRWRHTVLVELTRGIPQ